MNFRIFYSYLILPLLGFSSNFQSDSFNNDSVTPQQVQQSVQNETPAHAQLDSEINPEACIEIDTLPLLCQSGNIDICVPTKSMPLWMLLKQCCNKIHPHV